MTAVLTAGGPHERAALSYAERDWRVLVVAGQKPHGQLASHAYKSASTNPDAIRSWWRGYHDDNSWSAAAEREKRYKRSSGSRSQSRSRWGR